MIARQAARDLTAIQKSPLAYAILTDGDTSTYTNDERLEMHETIIRWTWAVSAAPYPSFTTGAKK